jgi:hypothetical protein
MSDDPNNTLASSELSATREVESVRPGDTESTTDFLRLACEEQEERIRQLDAQLAELPRLIRERDRLIALIRRIDLVLGLPLYVDTMDHWWEQRPHRGRKSTEPLLVGRSDSARSHTAEGG